MTDIPASVWLASAVSLTACLSAVVLAIQRRHHKFVHAGETQEAGHDPSPIRLDSERDLTVPYADNHRLTRIVWETAGQTILYAYGFYVQSTTLSPENDPMAIPVVIAAAAVLACWLYALTLAVVSRRYPLPDNWGWILNVHMWVFYMVALCLAIYDLWTVGVSQSTLSWSKGVPLLFNVVFGLDLVYTTATVERGAPFLDEEGRSVSTVTVASIFSFLYFNWVTPLVDLAHRKQKLDEEDLPILPPLYRGYNLYYIFGASRGRGLLYRIFDANRYALAIQISTAFVSSLMYYAPAYFMNQLLYLIQDVGKGRRQETDMKDGFVLVVSLGATILLLNVIVGQLWYWASSNVQVRIKSMLNIEIYRKTLRRKDTAVHAKDLDKSDDDKSKNDKDDEDENNEDVSSTGQIVNLMSTDSNRISEFSTWWFTLIAAPTELTIGIYFLYKLLGMSCFLGLLVMIIALPINHYNAKLYAKTQDQLMEARDKRVSLMNEVLQGIRQIKFFAWETSWKERIMGARIEELRHLKISYLCEVLFTFIWEGSPLLVTIVSFYSFTKIEGKELTAPIAFTAINVFNELRFALNALPETFIELLQALISVRRIQLYLDQEEIEKPPAIDPTQPVQIGFKDATVAWSASNADNSCTPSSSSENTQIENDGFILKNLNLEFPNNQLSLICGATGSGKTLLMLSLLGEATLLSGSMYCPRAAVVDTVHDHYAPPTDIAEEDWILDHAVAYVSQTAWLQNASIRDNITFGLPFVEKRYRDTLMACALDKDLSILEDGDLTEIGEKGITLSGGQKARVALARAVYSRAKNVLMDDVLSAVDAHTAKHLYEACITGPLMRDRTRILITHHVKLCLNACAYIVHVNDGQTDVVGSPSHLRQTGILATILEEDDAHDEEIVENDLDPEHTEAKPVELLLHSADKKTKVLVEEEERASGHVKARLYKLYLSMVGNWAYWVFIALLVFGARFLGIAESWWVKKWTQSNASSAGSLSTSGHAEKTGFASILMYFPAYPVHGSANDSVEGMNVFGAPEERHSLDFYLTIYILLTLSNVVIGTGRFAVLYMGVLRASRSLYERLLDRVFRAPLRFFDTTPVGRILNRFSKDFETIDSRIPNEFMNFLSITLTVITSVITVSTVLPAFVVPMVLVALSSFWLGRLFVPASRELKRMDSTSRSPLFSHFTETIVGVSTIRAFGATRQFLQAMLRRMDDNSRPFYYTWVVNRWVSVRFAALGAFANSVIAGAILLNLDKIDASSAGFALSFVLMFTDESYWTIRRYTNVELSFNAVERVVEFMEMDQEAPAITSVHPPASWPSEGAIQVQDLEVRYAADLDPVLKGVTFSVKPREKIGVVGRTGSGKSTLALSFFRFVEATRGRIVIDGIDIKDIGTEDLRSNLTIIPQDPTLFSGTLRSNMDPFDQFSDHDIFVALRRVHLLTSEESSSQAETVNANVFQDLSTPVSEGGKNFSQGQRQLLCLARALLKRTRIVLMDEATASVDFDTDKAIQKTIATEFADCTILCIAHRLHTVIEYDRILVLDQGEIVEFASPLELITNDDSVFSKMCRNSGEFDSLLALAKAKHELVDVS